MSKRVNLCKSHPDFHLPADVAVGEGFDGDAYAKRLKECGADAVAFFAKCHYGHSYYPTKVGTPHPGLRKDMLGEVVRGCHKHGLGVVAYYSVFLDTAAVRRHPDWRLKATADEPDAGPDADGFLPLCVNSPYADELLLPQCLEVVTGYDVDELFMDTMSGFTPCYCRLCREAFGRPIPQSPEDADWLRYVKWYYDRYEGFFAKVASAVHEARPDVAVTFNWKWGYDQPTMPVPHIGRLAADLIPTGQIASKITRYLAGTGYPYDYMCGRFLHGLGDWTSSTVESILYTASVTVANGAGFYIIDRQLPDGSLEERAYEMMRQVFGFLQERRQWLTEARHVPETGVLYSFDSVMGPDLRYFPDPKARTERTEPLGGVAQMFMEHARHYTALSAQVLNERIGEYRLVILPETDFLGAATKASLFDFVRSGGALLVTQSEREDLVDRELLEFAGVAYEGHSDLEYGYFARPGLEPIAARGRFSMVRPAHDAEELVPYVAPARAGGKKFGHGFAPPGQRDGHAVAISRKVGAGRVIYVAMPAFRWYLRYQNFYVARLVLELMDRLLPDPLLRVTTPAQVEAVAMRKAADLIVHLVNHSGKERLGGYYYPVTEYMPEIRDIGVSVKLDRPGREIFAVPARRKLPFTVRDGRAEMTIPSLKFLESILLPGYFAAGGEPARRANAGSGGRRQSFSRRLRTKQ